MAKYIIRRWTDSLHEETADSLLEAIKVYRQLKEEEPTGYCNIVKIPFRRRHPNFPLWFSLVSLILVILAQLLD